MSSWRLLIHGEASGPWNMGVDEALLRSASAGSPALRFYHWTGPWISLGYTQRRHAARLAAIEAQGVGVVHRVTGGRAVLHGSDLTYAVALPEELLPTGIQASYGIIANALVAGLRALDVDVERTGRSEGRGRSGPGPAQDFDCFAAPAMDEICVGGRKLVGSAQRRIAGGVLQHGSIRYRPDPEGASRAAGIAPEVSTSLVELGCRASLETLRVTLTQAFAREFDVGISPGELSSEEQCFSRARGRHPRPELLTSTAIPGECLLKGGQDSPIGNERGSTR